MRRLRFFIALSALIFAPSAQAGITIDPGVYEFGSVVVPSQKGPTAVVNLRSLSECRIRLSGEKAAALVLRSPKGLWLKIRVKSRISGNRGEAELIQNSPLGKRKIPLQLGDQLKPISAS